MKSNLKRMPVEDPAGFDKVLLAVGRAAVGWAESKVRNLGFNLDLWNGEDGVGAVVEQALKEQGIPNKRFTALVNPRVIAEHAKFIKRKRAKRIK